MGRCLEAHFAPSRHLHIHIGCKKKERRAMLGSSGSHTPNPVPFACDGAPLSLTPTNQSTSANKCGAETAITIKSKAKAWQAIHTLDGMSDNSTSNTDFPSKPTEILQKRRRRMVLMPA